MKHESPIGQRHRATVLAGLLASSLPVTACHDAGARGTPVGGHDGGECTVTLSPGANDQAAVQGALIGAKSGDTVCLGTGRFEFSDQLSLAAAHVTLRGVDGTVLDFQGQTSGANAIEVTADGDTIDTLHIENPKGDAIRATEVHGVTIRNAHIEWTGGPNAANGGYGIYPVSSSSVLIEKCFVSGASDTGIYVGQSSTIVVRDNETAGNVAGIEIENSSDAEVYANHSHDNAAGILVFNLPGLAVKDGKRANVHDNVVLSNNIPNFATAGNIVHDVPSGTGMFVLAADDNEIHGNTVSGNQSVGIAVLSWFIALRDQEGHADPTFDWYPEGNSVHDNTLSNNGFSPKDRALTIAALLGATTLSDIVWDGIIDWAKIYGDAGVGRADLDGGSDPSRLPAPMRNCFKSNASATFLDLDLDHSGKFKTSDAAPYSCEQTPLPAVTL